MARSHLTPEQLEDMVQYERNLQELTVEAAALTEVWAKLLNELDCTDERYNDLTVKVTGQTEELLHRLDRWDLVPGDKERACALLYAFQNLELSCDQLPQRVKLLRQQLGWVAKMDWLHAYPVTTTLHNTIPFTEGK